ncbi:MULTISPECIES: hypothetical protein [Actinotignum]|uniref:Transmembrane protein n=1 Tax=Actinotignum timonense TaxID=1870995 RepID=A0AAW9HL31_9ACTO|nr:MULTISPECIES: hypothetical protein [Actinotignum]MDE1558539.1 hypothetical protein [Actinotignum schaalii]MDE1663395.1 hypothetical protein [Actinotignum schaalii]MDK6372703.1 hypothetical protein [Actinotignum timonense]MDK6419789.1 hypothetical protein [Actinotignum timonense]MDK6589430.1 hypothetical protein [Actinotignum timonense]
MKNLSWKSYVSVALLIFVCHAAYPILDLIQPDKRYYAGYLALGSILACSLLGLILPLRLVSRKSLVLCGISIFIGLVAGLGMWPLTWDKVLDMPRFFGGYFLVNCGVYTFVCLLACRFRKEKIRYETFLRQQAQNQDLRAHEHAPGTTAPNAPTSDVSTPDEPAPGL